MKREVAWISLLIGLLLIAYSASQKLAVTDGQVVGNVSSAEIQGGVTVGQTFVAPYSGLYRIAIRVRTFERLNTHEIIFHLREHRRAGQEIFVTSFNGRGLKDTEWQYMSFPPVWESSGTAYYFYFESPQSTHGNAIAVMGQEGDPYRRGTAYQGSHQIPGDMVFKTFYKVPWRERFEFLVEQLTARKPSAWGNRYFYIGLGLVYFLLVIAFVVHTARLSGTLDSDSDAPESP